MDNVPAMTPAATPIRWACRAMSGHPAATNGIDGPRANSSICPAICREHTCAPDHAESVTQSPLIAEHADAVRAGEAPLGSHRSIDLGQFARQAQRAIQRRRAATPEGLW